MNSLISLCEGFPERLEKLVLHSGIHLRTEHGAG